MAQFYVAASRVGNPEHITFCLAKDANGSYKTPNVVYRDALSCISDVPDGFTLIDDATDQWQHCELGTLDEDSDTDIQ